MSDPASLSNDTIIDGYENGQFDGGPLFLPDYPATMLISQVLFGVTFDIFYPNDFDMRNIKLGSEGFGSDDLWNPTFSSSLVPPFDFYVGTPGDMTVSGGVITVNNAGAAAYGVHALSAGVREIWVQYELYLRPSMFSLGSASAGFHEFLNQDGHEFGFLGIEDLGDPLGSCWLDQAGSFFFSGDGDPAAPTPNTWMTVQQYAQIIGGSNGKMFDHAASHKAHR